LSIINFHINDVISIHSNSPVLISNPSMWIFYVRLNTFIVCKDKKRTIKNNILSAQYHFVVEKHSIHKKMHKNFLFLLLVLYRKNFYFVFNFSFVVAIFQTVSFLLETFSFQFITSHDIIIIMFIALSFFNFLFFFFSRALFLFYKIVAVVVVFFIVWLWNLK
jgi:hypothetical protein